MTFETIKTNVSQFFDVLSVDLKNFVRGGVGAVEKVLPEDAKSAVESATGVTPYDELPDPPSPEPETDTSLDSIDPTYVQQFQDLETQMAAALGAIGASFTRLETYRSDERQQWLWGIGRLYKAPGRTGIVTDFRTATHDAHGQRRAADYNYQTNGVATEAEIMTALKSIADSRGDLTWGGNWVSPHDPAHWQANKS